MIVAAILVGAALFSTTAGADTLSLGVGDQTRVTVGIQSFTDLRDENVVKQALDYSCGAAALATLLTFGMDDPTSELEVVTSIIATLEQDEEALREKEGFSLLDLQRVAHDKGYRAEGFRIAPDALDDLRGSVIVFIQPRGYEHFAVLRGVRGDRVYLADPSIGNVRRADYDFLDMWLGADGMGIIFVIQPETGSRPGTVPLALDDRVLPRPERLSVQQLRNVGPASLPDGRLP